MKTFKLSPSSISLMEECKRCFWLEKHKVWGRPVAIFPSLPSGMDNILKKHFDKFRDRNQLPPELCNQKSCENLRLFGINDEEKQLLSLWRNNKKGISYTDSDGSVLYGAVDNILVKDSKLIVLDYKTRGFPLKEDTPEHYKNQMDIYNFLLKKNGYEVEDYGFLLFYFPKEILDSGEVVFDTELVKLSVNPGNAERLWRKAINILNEDCPKETCKWCEHV